MSDATNAVLSEEEQQILDSEAARYHFGACICGRLPDLRANLGSDNYMACSVCQTFWCVGSNLFSDWRVETEEIWARNRAMLAGYTEIESTIPDWALQRMKNFRGVIPFSVSARNVGNTEGCQ